MGASGATEATGVTGATVATGATEVQQMRLVHHYWTPNGKCSRVLNDLYGGQDVNVS